MIGRHPLRPVGALPPDTADDRHRHVAGDLVLHCEDVGEVAVVALASHPATALGLDELHRDAHPLPHHHRKRVVQCMGHAGEWFSQC